MYGATYKPYKILSYKEKSKQSWRWELFPALYFKTMLVEITGTCHVRCCKKLISLCRHSFYRNRFLNSTLVYAFDVIFPLKKPFLQKSHDSVYTHYYHQGRILSFLSPKFGKKNSKKFSTYSCSELVYPSLTRVICIILHSTFVSYHAH